MVVDEEDRLKHELDAYREAESIVELKKELGFVSEVDAREASFYRQYPKYRHVTERNPEKIEEHIERLERDLQMLKDDDLFSDLMDE